MHMMMYMRTYIFKQCLMYMLICLNNTLNNTLNICLSIYRYNIYTTKGGRMKTEIEHCKHYDVKHFKKKKTCKYYDEDVWTACELMVCLGHLNNDDCYEE